MFKIVIAQWFECPTPPSTMASSVEPELIFQRDARLSKCESVAEGPQRAFIVVLRYPYKQREPFARNRISVEVRLMLRVADDRG